VPEIRPLALSGRRTRQEGHRSTQKGFAISRDLRINQMIRVYDLRVVDEDGSQLGVMRTADALRLAQERGLDLVEVAPLATPPVARLLDFGQYKYELTKREKEAKRRQRAVTFKEVRLKPKIGQGDFDTKVRRAIEFLQEGDRVKVSVQFRGRELTHPQIGRDLLDRFAELIKDHGVVERPPLLEGKSMHISVASVHKPKVHEPPHQAADKATSEGSAPAEEAEAQPAAKVEAPVKPARSRSAPQAGSEPVEKVN
jgi:translation initiation factor IF-3